jgi:hypothetical protein
MKQVHEALLQENAKFIQAEMRCDELHAAKSKRARLEEEEDEEEEEEGEEEQVPSVVGEEFSQPRTGAISVATSVEDSSVRGRCDLCVFSLCIVIVCEFICLAVWLRSDIFVHWIH